jgi:outer membrane lipoprotein carrier protein
MRRLFVLAAACIAIPLSGVVTTPACAADAAATRIERYLAGSGSMKADFVQTQFSTTGTELRRATGIFYLRRPGRFRWEYLAPEQQLIVCDGRDIWMYEHDLQQVTIRSLAEATDATPAMILARTGGVGEVFTVEDAGRRDGLEWFRLAPRAADPEFRGIELGFRGDDLHTMRFTDRLQQTTVIEFAALDRRARLADPLFRFTPPRGVDVVGRPSAGR